MFTVTDTAFNFLVLQFVLHASGLGGLLLRIFAPVRAGSEYDIFSTRTGVSDTNLLNMKTDLIILT